MNKNEKDIVLKNGYARKQMLPVLVRKEMHCFPEISLATSFMMPNSGAHMIA